MSLPAGGGDEIDGEERQQVERAHELLDQAGIPREKMDGPLSLAVRVGLLVDTQRLAQVEIDELKDRTVPPVAGDGAREALRLEVAQAIARSEDERADWERHWSQSSQLRFLAAADAVLTFRSSPLPGAGDGRAEWRIVAADGTPRSEGSHSTPESLGPPSEWDDDFLGGPHRLQRRTITASAWTDEPAPLSGVEQTKETTR